MRAKHYVPSQIVCKVADVFYLSHVVFFFSCQVYYLVLLMRKHALHPILKKTNSNIVILLYTYALYILWYNVDMYTISVTVYYEIFEEKLAWFLWIFGTGLMVPVLYNHGSFQSNNLQKQLIYNIQFHTQLGRKN